MKLIFFFFQIDHRGAENIFEKEFRSVAWKIGHDQQQMEYFSLSKDDTIMLSVQDGIFCNNCINCLDQINVVQSMLPKRKITDVFMIIKENEFGGFRGTNDL
ncbi:hypothetical protein PV328_010475 [Microctonus aethiopoides]|uniref:SAC domain-containing protein n=1 Tax=Microctonus aethiopoides TaxID=144406 RepID=A0AA39KQ68_9HYME|nr:hypothetical protein PV328_010475 [Microctonus aethiopoides]